MIQSRNLDITRNSVIKYFALTVFILMYKINSGQEISHTVDVPFEVLERRGVSRGYTSLADDGVFRIPKIDSGKFEITNVSFGMNGIIGGAAWAGGVAALGGPYPMGVHLHLSLGGVRFNGSHRQGDTISLVHFMEFPDVVFYENFFKNILLYDGLNDSETESTFFPIYSRVSIVAGHCCSLVSSLAFHDLYVRVTYTLIPIGSDYNPDDLPEAPANSSTVNSKLDLRAEEDLFAAPYMELPGSLELPSLPIPSVEAGATQMVVAFSGILQTSSDLKNWTDVDPQPLSPWSIPKPETKVFFRSRTYNPSELLLLE